MACDKQINSANPEDLFRAVFVVLARYQREGLEPGAEKWQSDTRRYRPELVGDVLVEWSTAYGDDTLFPWHEDFVASMWVAARKLSTREKCELCETYAIEIPKEWKQREEAGRECFS